MKNEYRSKKFKNLQAGKIQKAPHNEISENQ